MSCSLIIISVHVTIVSQRHIVIWRTLSNHYVTRYSARFDCGTSMLFLLGFLDASKKCHSLLLFANFEIHPSHLHSFFVSTSVNVLLLHSCIRLEDSNQFLSHHCHAVRFHDASAPLGFQFC